MELIILTLLVGSSTSKIFWPEAVKSVSLALEHRSQGAEFCRRSLSAIVTDALALGSQFLLPVKCCRSLSIIIMDTPVSGSRILFYF